jgi:hypothetical protein
MYGFTPSVYANRHAHGHAMPPWPGRAHICHPIWCRGRHGCATARRDVLNGFSLYTAPFLRVPRARRRGVRTNKNKSTASGLAGPS